MSVIFGLTVDTDTVDKSFGESFGGWDDIQKALTHKYIRRIPKKSGKGYWYIYAETFQKPLAALKTFFGLQTKAISDTYDKNDIKKDFGADKKTFAAHLLEYLSNKLKWDTFFKKKENSDEYKAPKKSPPAGNGGGKKTGGTVDKNTGQGDNKIVLNRSLMRRIWGIYNKTEEENGTNNLGVERGEISASDTAVRSGGSEVGGDQYVSGAETGDDGGESLQLPNSTGDRPARDVRRTVKQTKNIREACLNLLNTKTDDQMTEEDKALLRQYEGAGGLGEEGASTHGTLYEYYTPRTVTKKVWEIVDKYIPGKKNVLEPSSGIGRFAEDRPDDVFTLNEFDKTSARIAGILHPDKTVKQGAFQEMFKPGKEYAGQKYDVVIGNPPYGAYEGLWKGRGEGKGHTRYEEYFIDRGLDTMREGGIMAFVVPSDFLRKGNSKIKEKIAAKGKLLEAWRLPNGTFSTTGVGTDIILIRKEKGGNSADFSDNAFFEKNPDMVMGAETTRIGRYGKEEKYIGLADGESFDEAIDRIRADKIEAVPIGAQTQAEQAKEKVKAVVEGGKTSKKDLKKIKQNNYEIDKLKFELSEQERTFEYMRPEIEHAREVLGGDPTEEHPMTGALIRDWKERGEYIDRLKADISKLENENRELEKPKGRSRSEAMMGNQNAAGSHDVDTLAEFNKKYNKNIPEQAIPIWKATNWDGSIDLSQLKDTTYLEKSGNYVKTADGKWYDVVNYASGNIYQKLKELERDKDDLTAAEYKRQKAILEAAKPTPKTVHEFTVSPLSDFAGKYVIEEELNDKQDSLIQGFKDWVWDLGMGSVPPSITKHDIIDYVNRKSVRADSKASDKEAAARERDNTIKVRREATEALFNQYIRENLSTQEQERMAEMWNRQFNAVVDPDHTKIPAFVDGISRTFKGDPLKVSDIQLKGVATLVNRGNGILAYDVGVGKLNPLSEPVLTPKGWTTIGQLKEGDYVIAVDGTPTKVLKIYPQGVLDIYTVKFSDGSTSRCGYEHLWDVQFPYQRNKGQCYGNKADEWKTLTTREIHDDMKKSGRGDRKYTIPICEPVQFEKQDLPIPPYAMGYLLGNGYIGERFISVVIPDEYVRNKISALLPNGGFLKENQTPIEFYLRGVDDWRKSLKELGLSGKHSYDKFLPDNYKYSTVNDRIELLRGLMDSDGTVGGSGNSTPIFYTTSKELSEDIKELIQSLGGTVTVHQKLGKYKKDGETVVCRLCYSVSMRLKEINPFSLPRKADKFVKHTKYLPVRFIEKIEYSHKEESACILVEHPRHLFITNDYIVTHNTLTGILATVSQIQTGRAKKPLICVPKSVYKNWIAEIQQLFPNIKINDLYNFRNIEHLKNPDGTLNIEEGTLSICTYEATQMISFKPETINNELMADMLDSQSAVGVKASDRDKAAEKERIQTKLGKATKAGDRQTNWEDTGFDHITVDELHNFKNIFSQAKGKEKTSKEEGNANEFTKITGGTPSDQALKLFAITQMVQRENNGRNVFGLTATPFTNSPIEIYNILSLVAREKLKETGIYNLHEFMAQFAALKSELAVDSQGDVAEKTVMKEFKNLVALQKLINTYIDKVDGEEAGVIRPKKSIHYEDCTLNMTLAQKDIAEQIIHYMDTADPKEDPGAALKGINALRQLALSPRLLEKSNIVTLPDDMGDFVTSSPKMTFVCDSAAELSKTAGQVIYLPQGISYYKEVKDYLVKRGVDPEAVAFLSPQHLPSGTNKDGSDRGEEEKARIMKDFNDPNGKIKIIIGSETIKEGVNLNGNTSTLYNCMLDWNPTDAIQVEGRIHRQGNKQGHVHIVYPLMNDSIDSFMYQKHDEKSKRIAAVFSYKGDTLNVEEINPEEAKFSLIKDPAKRAGMQIKQEIEVIKNQVLIAQATCDKIVENASRRREYQDEIKNCQKQLEQIKKAAKKISEMSDAELIREYGNKYRENDESIEQRFDEFDGVKESSWVEGKNPKDFRKEYDRVSRAATQYLQKYITSARSKSETVENTLKRYNVDPTNEKSANDVATKFAKEAVKLKDKIKNIESKRDEYIEKARVQIAKEAKPGLTVADATKIITRDITKNLRPMDEVKEEILAEREAKKNAEVKKSVVFVIDSVIQKRV